MTWASTCAAAARGLGESNEPVSRYDAAGKTPKISGTKPAPARLAARPPPGAGRWQIRARTKPCRPSSCSRVRLSAPAPVATRIPSASTAMRVPGADVVGVDSSASTPHRRSSFPRNVVHATGRGRKARMRRCNTAAGCDQSMTASSLRSFFRVARLRVVLYLRRDVATRQARERICQQPRAEHTQAVVQRAGGIGVGDRGFDAGPHRPGVEAGLHLHDAYAGDGVAGLDGARNRRRAAPAR